MRNYFIKDINGLKDKINCYEERLNKLNYKINEERLNDLNCKIDKVVDSLAWWIPIRKWRDGFRDKFKVLLE